MSKDVSKKILHLLTENARYSNRDIAVMLGLEEAEVEKKIADMERDGIIRKYKTVVDWERLDHAYVSALIEIKVTPQPDLGFEQIAQNIMKYDEVESVYLMSGGYDLMVMVTGRTFQEVAMFVAKELAPMRSVVSTGTHFVLRRYKENNVELLDSTVDDRGRISL